MELVWMSLRVGEGKLSGGKSQVHAHGGMDSAPWCGNCHFHRNVTQIHLALESKPVFLHTLRNVLQCTPWFRQLPPRINHFLSGPNLINFTSLIDPTLSTLFFFFSSNLVLHYFIPSVFSPYSPASWLVCCWSRLSASLSSGGECQKVDLTKSLLCLNPSWLPR